MKKLLSSLSLLAAVSMSGSLFAHLEPRNFGIATDHTHACKLTYHVRGGGFQLILGYFKLKGIGEVVCEEKDGSNKVARPVKVTMGGCPLAPRVAICGFSVHGGSASIGSNGNIDEFYGHYLYTGAEAALVLGPGVSINMKNPRNDLRISLTVEGVVGFGFEVGMSLMHIEPIDEPADDVSCPPLPPVMQQQQRGPMQQRATTIDGPVQKRGCTVDTPCEL